MDFWGHGSHAGHVFIHVGVGVAKIDPRKSQSRRERNCKLLQSSVLVAGHWLFGGGCRAGCLDFWLGTGQSISTHGQYGPGLERRDQSLLGW